MPRAIYPYLPFAIAPTAAKPRGSLAYRPVIIATITPANGQSVRLLALPDSGADTCLFPLSIAALLGLDPDTLPSAATIGVGHGNNVTFYAPLRIDLGNGMVFDTFAGFTSGLDALGLGLLGQDGFFEKHWVEFRHAEKIVSVEAIR